MKEGEKEERVLCTCKYMLSSVRYMYSKYMQSTNVAYHRSFRSNITRITISAISTLGNITNTEYSLVFHNCVHAHVHHDKEAINIIIRDSR